MPDLLIEFLSEEIPARMQVRAAEDLRKLVTDRLVAEGLTYDGASAFVTPRRLALTVHGLPANQPDVKEEKKGPRVGAPDNAVAGFLKAAGLKSINEAKVQPDKKGDFYVAVIDRPGRMAIDVIKDVVSATVVTFPWPKSMRWGPQSGTPGSLSWVRPLHSIVATFGPETEEPAVVPIDIDGIKANFTECTFVDTSGEPCSLPHAHSSHPPPYLADRKAIHGDRDPSWSSNRQKGFYRPRIWRGDGRDDSGRQ